MFEGFQLPKPGVIGDPIVFDVPPLSFFVMDTRSCRDRKRQFAQTPSSLDCFHTWVRRVANSKSRLFGVIVSGQSLLDEAAGRIGAVIDDTLANYGDYRTICKELVRLADSGKRFLLVTGDVHWGRVTKGTYGKFSETPCGGFFEVISSPASLCETVGIDQVRTLFAGIKSIFGRSDPFPRHAEPKEPADFLAFDILGKRFECKSLHAQKGNQVAMLSFCRSGSELKLTVRFWPIHSRFNVENPTCVGPLTFV